MAYRMFAGELDGELMLTHLSFRKDDVRLSIAQLFYDGSTHKWSYDMTKRFWREALKAGWRVVPVVVAKATVPGLPRPRAKRRHWNGSVRGLGEPTAAECARNRAWDQVG